MKQAQGFKERFYFIQDYEPYFYAGAVAMLASYQGLGFMVPAPG